MNAVRKLGLVALALTFVFVTVSPLFAQTAEQHKQTVEVLEAKGKRQSFASPGWGAGIGAGLVIIGAAMGFGRIGAAALESMARQPETAGRVQTAMIIIAALLEGATFFALIICINVAGGV